MRSGQNPVLKGKSTVQKGYHLQWIQAAYMQASKQMHTLAFHSEVSGVGSI